MTDFEKTYQNYNPRQAALDEARALLTAAAKAAMADGTLPEAELPAFIVEIPADVKNGDIASNLAMAGARTWRKAPKMIADALLAHLPSLENSVFSKVEVAGPGFINLFLSQSFWAGVVLGACANKEYGRTDHGKGAKYNVEFVSANPTGPMHMGNARGGALGDCLAAVLDWSGYDVTREFYINDAGNQIQKFGKSLAVRYLQQFCGEDAYPLPKECYQGGDIKVLAGEFAELNGDKYVAACKGMDEEALFESEAFAALKDALVAYALPKNIAALKRDLGKYRIDYDVWFHESTLHESGAVLAVVDKLLEFDACVDCGTPINPNLTRVQTEGGLLQGIGMTLTENITYDKNGYPEENSLFQYKIPARTDVGKIKVEFESSYEPNGPFGAKSIGEVVINTPLPAISDAIYNAIGTRFYELPITPEKIAMAVAEKQK